MSDRPQDAGSTLGIAERRLHVRRQDIALAYVEIDESNGGIILNISEGGLVLTAAEPLPDDCLPLMRFQLPGSNDWIEASGEIAWISESKREAGMRFVDISEDARNRIKSWMPSESPAAPSRRGAIETLGEMKQTSDSVAAETSVSTNAESPAIPALPHVSIPDSLSAADAIAPVLDANQSTTTPSSQERPAASDNQPHVENPTPNPDRRRHLRRRDNSLAYIDLGGNNGGIILNISEGGLMLAAAAPLQGDRLPKMRFQLPGSVDWIEVIGEIAWISDSKREAGVRFLTMRDEGREQIRVWVASETASLESQRVENGSRGKGGRLLQMPAARETKSGAQSPATFEHTTPGYSTTSSAPSSARRTISAAALAAAMTPAIPSRRLPERAALNPESNLAARPVQVVVQRRSWENVVGIVLLASAVSFVAGWFAAGPVMRSRVLHIFERSTTETTKPVASTPVQEAAPKEIVATPPNAHAAVAALSSQTPTVNPPAGAAEPASPTVAANLASEQPDKPRVEPTHPDPGPSSTAADASQRTVENAPATDANKAPAASKEIASTPPSPIVSPPAVSQPDVVRAAAAVPDANSPTPAPTVQPEVFKGTVAVSFSAYPSIRVPAELKSQMSRQGASLQIGRLTARIDPVYPADAERQHIEGTVRVHAIIGRDGAVQSVAQLSGTSLLAQAVTDAVLQWRYQPTSIGGRAVEAEEDVVVVFKLVSQASQPN
jgi:periplasmic protein TonB